MVRIAVCFLTFPHNLDYRCVSPSPGVVSQVRAIWRANMFCAIDTHHPHGRDRNKVVPISPNAKPVPAFV